MYGGRHLVQFQHFPLGYGDVCNTRKITERINMCWPELLKLNTYDEDAVNLVVEADFTGEIRVVNQCPYNDKKRAMRVYEFNNGKLEKVTYTFDDAGHSVG